jgi:ABC-type Fe3+-hydroxamate transport system substrate-binding protein
MKPARYLILAAAALLIAGCGTRTESSVTPATNADQTVALKPAPKAEKDVIVTENDITNRPYVALGDIEVTVKKWTIFDADPTREMVADALRKKAAEMGADAVVLARYGTVGIGFTSWGQMDGQGRAVVFKQ